MKESALQSLIVDYLRTILPPSQYRVCAMPNASRRTASGRASNAVAGLTPGFPDLMILGAGRLFLMEVKTTKGALSDVQTQFGIWCNLNRTPWAVVRSLNDVDACLSFWGIETRRAK